MDTNETKKQGRVSYSAEERRGLLAEFESSGVTQAAFCREWNINPATLGKWLRAGHEEEAKISFCEVEPVSGLPSIGKVRVCLPNGIEVVVPVGSPDELGAILREAAQCLG